nr:MAG TPA: hypothetical protein [Caudoviricetes sp.]
MHRKVSRGGEPEDSRKRAPWRSRQVPERGEKRPSGRLAETPPREGPRQSNPSRTPSPPASTIGKDGLGSPPCDGNRPFGTGSACGGPAGDVRGKLRQLIRPDVSSTSHEPS